MGEAESGVGFGSGEAAKESRWQAESVTKVLDSGSEQGEVRSRDGGSVCADALRGAATYTDATGMKKLDQWQQNDG